MAKINGTLVIFTLDGEELAHVQDATLSINRELPDSTDKDSAGWEEHLNDAGLRNWEISVNGWASYDDDSNLDDLMALILTRQSATIVWGPTTGDIQLTGDASLGGLELGAPNEDTATISGTLTGNGPLELVGS